MSLSSPDFYLNKLLHNTQSYLKALCYPWARWLIAVSISVVLNHSGAVPPPAKDVFFLLFSLKSPKDTSFHAQGSTGRLSHSFLEPKKSNLLQGRHLNVRSNIRIIVTEMYFIFPSTVLSPLLIPLSTLIFVANDIPNQCPSVILQRAFEEKEVQPFALICYFLAIGVNKMRE